MRAFIGWAVVFVAAACGGAPPAPAPAPQPPSPSPQPAPTTRDAPATTSRWTIVGQGRTQGSLAITANPDGTFGIAYDVVENGRGPHVDATLRVGADGLLDRFTATGHHTMGNALNETFTRTGGRAHWTSEAEAGDADASTPAFYVPLADGTIDPWLVPAALHAGGTLALWPSGTARVTKVAELAIEGRALVCYAVAGFTLDPYYSWFDADGAWFGWATPFSSTVPAGWEKAIPALIAKQKELDRARAAEIAKRTAHAPPAAGLAYTHARVLDVERGTWVPNQTVVIVGDTIRAVGKAAAIPAGAEIVDLAGKALLPGLIDMHSHTDRDSALLDIATGVTTVRDVGNEPDFLDDLKAHFDDGTAVGPHIVRMGFIEGRGPKAASSTITAETPAEAKAAVEFYAKRGYDGIKIYNSMKTELVPLLAAEAHERGMLVTGHIPVHMLAHEAVEAGYDGIEHINMLFLNFEATHETDTRDTTRFTLVGDQAASLDLAGKPVRDFIAELVAHHTVIDPTLDAFEDLFLDEPGKLPPDLAATVGRLPSQLARSYLAGGLPVTPEKHARYVASWANILAMVKALWQAKVPVVAGTDEIGGVFFLHELDLLASAGIPRADVLRMATIGAARAMRQDKAFGTIAAGKRADLVVIDGDPLADLAQLRKVVTTMRGGVVYASGPLFEAVSVAP
jgi:imidazolonepropionase-like amidohydrolase